LATARANEADLDKLTPLEAKPDDTVRQPYAGAATELSAAYLLSLDRHGK